MHVSESTCEVDKRETSERMLSEKKETSVRMHSGKKETSKRT